MTKRIEKRSAAPVSMNGSGLQRAFRFKDLSPYTGLKRTQLRELIKQKKFPQGVHPSADSRTKIWFENQLVEWQSARGAR